MWESTLTLTLILTVILVLCALDLGLTCACALGGEDGTALSGARGFRMGVGGVILGRWRMAFWIAPDRWGRQPGLGSPPGLNPSAQPRV